MPIQTNKYFLNSQEHLLAELKRIELKLDLRLKQAQEESSQTQRDDFRGLYISDEMLADQGLKKPFEPSVTSHSGDSISNINEQSDQLEKEMDDRIKGNLKLGQTLKLEELRKIFHLSQFEVDTLLICLLPEINIKYREVYAYLQDDITRKNPGVGLVLSLLCEKFEDWIEKREVFSPESPLIKYKLVNLLDGQTPTPSSSLSKSLQIDERVISFLLGTNRVDERLLPLTSLAKTKLSIAEMIFPEGFKRRLNDLRKEARDKEIVFYFRGANGTGRHTTAEGFCSEANIPLLTINVDKILTSEIPIDNFIPLIFREGCLQRAAIYFQNFDHWSISEKLSEISNHLTPELNKYPLWIFLAGEKDLHSDDVLLTKPFVNIEFPVPGYAERKQLWEKFWNAGSKMPDGLNFSDLAGMFRMSGGQIRNVVTTAKNIAIARDPANATITPGDIYAACRRQFVGALENLAHKIKPVYSWNDIVLPKDQMDQLHEICGYMKNYNTVYGDWGFGHRISLGKGLNVLFAGPSGTGKTMAAEILANELGLDLYKIDLSTIVSKYIGETEKNLDRIFEAAQNSNAILFFDEADALFGKRSEVRDSHDRYANVEVAYLLQKMEEYEGMVILATNLRKNMDDAFARRMHFVLEFPVPEEPDRYRIWTNVFPGEAPLDKGTDLVFMARQFKITGGNIKNIAIGAAFLAADNGGKITMEHLIHATKREYQKTGKLCTEGDFGAYFELVKG